MTPENPKRDIGELSPHYKRVGQMMRDTWDDLESVIDINLFIELELFDELKCSVACVTSHTQVFESLFSIYFIQVYY